MPEHRACKLKTQTQTPLSGLVSESLQVCVLPYELFQVKEDMSETKIQVYIQHVNNTMQ